MKLQAVKPFDQSTIPNDMCPIATEFAVVNTGDWRAERPVVDRKKCVKCATCWALLPHTVHRGESNLVRSQPWDL